MGSFNTTCFVTNQTIASNDRALVFPIVMQKGYSSVELVDSKGEEIKAEQFTSSTCYPSRFWDFAGPFLTGEYDDYGQFLYNNTPANIQALRYVFNSLHRNAFETLPGKNSSHDVPFDMKKLYEPATEYSFDQLIEIMETVWTTAVHEHRIFVSDYQGKPSQFCFAAMSQHAADFMINRSENSKDWMDKLPLDRRSRTRRILTGTEHFRNDDKKDVVTEFAKIQAEVEPTDDMKFEKFSLMRRISSETFFTNTEGSRPIPRFYDNHRCENAILEKIMKMISDGQTAVNDELVEFVVGQFSLMFDHQCITNELMNMNVSISPLVYASQDYSNECGKEYTALVAYASSKISEDRRSEYDEDYDEDNEEVG